MITVAMKILLALSSLIDAVNEHIGRVIAWLVMVTVFVSAGAATVRYGFDMGSNAWLELQWYLFSAIFLLGAGYTLKKNGHVRIDVVSTRLTPRGRAWIDIIGGLLFLMPMALIVLWLSWPMFLLSWTGNEVSADAGGLIRWPVKLLIPAGFALLALQGASEIIKRIAFLCGAISDPGQPAESGRGPAGSL